MKVANLIPWGHGRREAPVRRQDRNTDPVQALRSDINHAFEGFWRAFDLPMLAGSDFELLGGTMPRVNVRETEKEVEVTAELPGMTESDVDVSVDDGMLTIRGQQQAERESEEKGYVLRERSFDRIERVIPLPEQVEPDTAKATFKNGLLTVTIPKARDAQASTRHIQVQRG
jgi:HSP20 family protein